MGALRSLFGFSEQLLELCRSFVCQRSGQCALLIKKREVSPDLPTLDAVTPAVTS